jgi:hypothetical protein
MARTPPATHKSHSDLRIEEEIIGGLKQQLLEANNSGARRRKSSAENWSAKRPTALLGTKSPATTMTKVLKPSDLQQPPRHLLLSMNNQASGKKDGSGERPGKPARRSMSTTVSPTSTSASSSVGQGERNKPKRAPSAVGPGGSGPQSLPAVAGEQFYYFGCQPFGSGASTKMEKQQISRQVLVTCNF